MPGSDAIKKIGHSFLVAAYAVKFFLSIICQTQKSQGTLNPATFFHCSFDTSWLSMMDQNKGMTEGIDDLAFVSIFFTPDQIPNDRRIVSS